MHFLHKTLLIYIYIYTPYSICRTGISSPLFKILSRLQSIQVQGFYRVFQACLCLVADESGAAVVHRAVGNGILSVNLHGEALPQLLRRDVADADDLVLSVRNNFNRPGIAVLTLAGEGEILRFVQDVFVVSLL